MQKAGPVALAWSGGTGDVTIMLSQIAGTANSTALCKVPASSAQFTVPTDILAAMSDGEATVVISQSAQASVRAADYDVSLTVNTSPNPATISLSVQ